jgi:hypothetical protein
MLDDFRVDEMNLHEGHGFSHGELSSRMAEEHGFNVYRLQVGSRSNGTMDIPAALKDLDKAIEDGTVKLAKGDFVNMSLALDTTFAKAQKMLGMEITPENLRERRGEILDAMKAKVADEATPDKDRKFLRHALAINEGIQKLQDRGITFLTAEGNDGPQQFNIGALNADRHYAALTADGQPADYSARNSQTTDGRGDIDLLAKPVDALDPTPFAQQTGTYRLDGDTAHISAKDFGGMLEINPSIHSNQILISDEVNVPLEPINQKAWIDGTPAFHEQGTSFVNVYELPKELDKSED